MEAVPTIHLNIAELVVSRTPAVISTVLGSCISVCLFNESQGAGGMIHYALPKAPATCSQDEAFRYGNVAIPALVNELSHLTGLGYKAFQAKIVGGASVGEGGTAMSAVGRENIQIAKDLLQEYGISIQAEAVGGSHGRKILFEIPSGRVRVARVENRTKTLSHASPRKVLIVDDSKVIRDLLSRILREDPELTVVGQAADPLEAAELLPRLNPDVITLDIHMPRMTGVEWLEKLLPCQPIPVVMISSLQLQEGNEVFRALELGAVDYVQKPTLSELSTVSATIREKVKAASQAKVLRPTVPAVVNRLSGDHFDPRKVLAIGASTGGTEALKAVLCALPEKIPPTVIVQHIPPVFSKAFAERLNQLCPFEVKEAEDGDVLAHGRVLIAPGGKQMKVVVKGDDFIVRVNDDEPVNRHKPSVDYLFHSVATVIGRRAVGVILTGMGADGAKGLLEMKNKGAPTIGQDEASSVVYGMPRVAFEIGAVHKVAPLSEIPKCIVADLQKK